MNKQIKYRFWNKIGRFFEKSDKIAVNKDGDLVLYDYETGEWSVVKIEKTCLDVDQFTGIVDKNGKEIYEGDILYHFNEKMDIFVKRGDGGFIFVSKSGNHPEEGYYLTKECSSEMSIVGNIHKNPELLK